MYFFTNTELEILKFKLAVQSSSYTIFQQMFLMRILIFLFSQMHFG